MMSEEENFKEIINKRFNEKMEIEYALKFNFDEIVKKVINVKYKDDKLKILQKIIKKQQKEIEELKKDNEYQWEHRCKMAIELDNNVVSKDKIREKFLEAKGLYERGVQPQAQYTMKLLQELLEE